jgi:hypothetical protein
MSHNERCKECKVRVRELLEKTYGTVITNYRIPVYTKPGDLLEHPRYPALSEIYASLQHHRGFTEYVRASYVDVDFFVPDPGFIVEFDESQHFTEPRKVALAHYPADFPTGFSRETWMKRCDEIHSCDNDPPFRDEQRAWYDTLRDFLAACKGFQPTVRLYAGEREWCKMDPGNAEDVAAFNIVLGRTSPETGRLPGTDSPKNPIAANPVLDFLIRYEYLTNQVKLQFLLDCTTGIFDYESCYLGACQNKTNLLNSGGAGFKVYINSHFRNKGYQGPLFSDRNPWKYESVKELVTLNSTLSRSVSGSGDWFMLFCEYTLVKTSLHELTADVHDPHNADKYGYPDLVFLRSVSKEPGISGSLLRNFVVSCLNIGINPSEDHEGAAQETDQLAGCNYAEFQKRRKEWIGTAWHFINQVKAKMDARNLGTVMQWHKYALCSYETGPVFIRKRREFLLPRIARSFERYDTWDQARLRENLYEILGKDVIFLIGNYWDHFQGKQTVEFLEGNAGLAHEIKKCETYLTAYYKAISSNDDQSLSGCSDIPSKSDPQSAGTTREKTRDPARTPAGQNTPVHKECWTETGFLADLRKKTGSEKKVVIARKLIAWARSQGLDLGETCRIQAFIPFTGTPKKSRQLFRITPHGKLAFEFRFIDTYPQFAGTAMRREFIRYLNTIKGFDFSESSIRDAKYRYVDLEILEDPDNYEAFIAMATWFFHGLQNGKER